MFVRINQAYPIKFLVLDVNGARVTNGSPSCQIIKDSDNTYWNGTIWQVPVANLDMSHTGEGVYEYTFTPTTGGNYTIHCTEDTHNVNDTIGLEVFNEADRTIYGIINIPFTIKGLVLDEYGNRIENANPLCQIIRDADSYYWTGLDWSVAAHNLSMSEYSDGLYTYAFTPTETGMFTINMDDDINNLHDSYVLNVRTLDGAGEVVLVNAGNLTGPDGSHSYVITETGVAISGAHVAAYDANEQVAAATYTMGDGDWQMYIPPGEYKFRFSADNRETITMVRSVA